MNSAEHPLKSGMLSIYGLYSV
uniref:SKOR n=1 Tax=Arundo donax TaxID=35708 RepID=A0A0A9H3F6_ARUDO